MLFLNYEKFCKNAEDVHKVNVFTHSIFLKKKFDEMF